MADQLTRDDVLQWLQQDQAWGVLVAPTEWRPVDDEWLNLIHRAVLARWGNPAPQPVPVSERPWEREGWCDKRGMCWAWNWGICNWWEWVDSKLISYSSGDYTHCLPAHALPIPHQQKNAND